MKSHMANAKKKRKTIIIIIIIITMIINHHDKLQRLSPGVKVGSWERIKREDKQKKYWNTVENLRRKWKRKQKLLYILGKRLNTLGNLVLHTNWRKQIHTNKRVDQLGWRCSILTKVLNSRLENVAALNT